MDANLHPAEYQRQGIEFLYTRRAGILADEMGLGKTAQALLAAERAFPHGPVLVFCPAATVHGWVTECRRWTALEPWVAEPAVVRRHPLRGCAIVPYSTATAMRPALSAARWGVMVCDEAHYLKNPQAARTRAVLGSVARAAERLWFLTGTPIPNRVIELRTVLASMSGRSTNPLVKAACDWQGFAKRYCDLRTRRIRVGRRTKLIWDDTGSSNLPELRSLLLEGPDAVMLRRSKADVLSELPPIRRQVVVLDHDGMPSAPRGWNEQRALGALERGSAPELSEISRYRHDLGLAKAPHVAAMVGDMLAGGTPSVVVFCHHHDVAELLAGKLGVPYVTGATPTAERTRRVGEFAAGAFPVFVATAGSVGTGVDGLQRRCDVVVYAELDWVPGVVAQSEARLHRIGQKGSVTSLVVVTRDDLDSYVVAKVLGKEQVQQAVLDQRRESTMDSAEKTTEIRRVADSLERLEALIRSLVADATKRTAIHETYYAQRMADAGTPVTPVVVPSTPAEPAPVPVETPAAETTATVSATEPVPETEPDREVLFRELKQLGYDFPSRTRTYTLTDTLSQLRANPKLVGVLYAKFHSSVLSPSSEAPATEPAPAPEKAREPAPAPEPEAKDPVEIEAVRRAAVDLSVRLNDGGAKARELIRKVGGSDKLASVAPEKYADLVAAFNAEGV